MMMVISKFVWRGYYLAGSLHNPGFVLVIGSCHQLAHELQPRQQISLRAAIMRKDIDEFQGYVVQMMHLLLGFGVCLTGRNVHLPPQKPSISNVRARRCLRQGEAKGREGGCCIAEAWEAGAWVIGSPSSTFFSSWLMALLMSSSRVCIHIGIMLVNLKLSLLGNAD